MASKGEYKAVIDEEEGRPTVSRHGSTASITSLGRGSAMDRIANHPALPIAAYCVASILMTVTNKYVVSGKAFNMNFLLLTIQSSVCVACVAVCKQLGVISYPAFDPEAAKKWFPISFLLVCVIFSGSKALQYLPIQIYTIFKNLTIVLIAYGEVLYFPGSSITPLTLVSFGLMILSACVAASNDVMEAITGEVLTVKAANQSSMGYFWMALNCLVSAAFVLSMRKRIKITGFSDWETLVYNNLLSIPPLIIFSLIFEDWSYESLARNFPEDNRYSLLSLMAFSGAAAVGISFATAWVIRTTSSTTFSMVGALNKLPVAASGLLFFGDPATFSSVSSIILGFLAGLVYSAAKTAQKNQSAAAAPR